MTVTVPRSLLLPSRLRSFDAFADEVIEPFNEPPQNDLAGLAPEPPQAAPVPAPAVQEPPQDRLTAFDDYASSLGITDQPEPPEDRGVAFDRYAASLGIRPETDQDQNLIVPRTPPSAAPPSAVGGGTSAAVEPPTTTAPPPDVAAPAAEAGPLQAPTMARATPEPELPYSSAPRVTLPGASPPAAPASTSTMPAAVPQGPLVDYARQAAQRAGIDPDLFTRQIQQESGFRTDAVSPAGARGIAQIVPKYHPNVDPSDPYASLDYAATLMASHLKTYGGDMRKALIAYNGGGGAVQADAAGQTYRESADYVDKILGGGAPSGAKGTDWLTLATNQLNKPYIWGSGSGAGGRGTQDIDPQTGLPKGFDCSGFVSFVMKEGLGIDLPAFTGSAYQKLAPVQGEPQPGDIVFWNMNNPDPRIQHMAIYIGGGKVIQAGGGQGKGVNIADMNAIGTPEFRRPTGDQASLARSTVGTLGKAAGQVSAVKAASEGGPQQDGWNEAQRRTLEVLGGAKDAVGGALRGGTDAVGEAFGNAGRQLDAEGPNTVLGAGKMVLDDVAQRSGEDFNALKAFTGPTVFEPEHIAQKLPRLLEKARLGTATPEELRELDNAQIDMVLNTLPNAPGPKAPSLGTAAGRIAQGVGDDVAEAGAKLFTGVADLPTTGGPAQILGPRGQVLSTVATGGTPPLSTPRLPARGAVDEVTALRPSKVTDADARASMEHVLEGMTPEQMAARARGVVTDEAAREAAIRTPVSVSQILRLPEGTVVTKEKLTAVRSTIDNHGKALALLRAEIVTDPTVAVAYANEFLTHTKLLQAQKALGTEAGRTVQAFHMVSKTADARELVMRQVLDRAGPEFSEYAAKRMAQLDVAGKLGDQKEVGKLLAELSDPSLTDKLVEFATAIKLYGIPTHLVNTLTSEARVLYEIPRTALSALNDATVGKVLYSGSRERYFSEVPGVLLGIRHGLIAGAKNAVKALADENYTLAKTGKLGDLSSRRGGMVLGAIRGKPGGTSAADRFQNAIGPVVRGSFRALGAEDALVRPQGEMLELYRQAYRKAASEAKTPDEFQQAVQRIIDAPDADMVEAVKKAGDRVLFQDELGKNWKALNEVRNQVPIVKLIVPFYKTPINLMAQTVDMSVLAPILTPGGRGMVASMATGGAKGISRGAAMDQLAQLEMAALATIPAFLWAAEGNITLDAGKTPTERDAFYRQKKQPYSVRLPGTDQWISYDRFSPFGEFLTFAAIGAKARENKDDKALNEQVMQAVGMVARNQADKSFLTGIGGFVDTLLDDQRSPDKFIGQTLTGMTIPSVVSRGVVSADPTIRKPEGLAESFAAKLPGLSQTVPADLDAWGRPKQRPTSGLESFVAPTVRTSPTDDRLETELARLQEAGFSVQPGDVGKTVTLDGVPMELTRDQQRQYQILSGQKAYAELTKRIASAGWSRLSDDKQAKEIDRVVSDAREAARAQLEREMRTEITIRKRELATTRR